MNCCATYTRDIGKSMEMSTVSCVNGVLTAVVTAAERLQEMSACLFDVFCVNH